MGIKVRQKDGKWYVFINHRGRRKAMCIGTSKRAAEEVKHTLEARLILDATSVFAPTPPVTTFAEYAEHWLATHAMLTCKPSSHRIFTSIVHNHLLPAFGPTDLRRLTRRAIVAFLTTKTADYAPRYVRNVLRTLHTICAQALADDLLDRNPAAALGQMLSAPHPPADDAPRVFTSTELGRYLATMQDRYPQHYAYFLCLARTGMREGEALGLRWGDIQWGQNAQDSHRFLHVQRTYDPVHHTFNTPKNGQSRRVDMSQELRAVLLEVRQQRREAALRDGMPLPAVVFCGKSGTPLAPSGLYTIHRRVCRLAGLRETRVHDLRHTYATVQLYEHHAPIQYVSEQLGHQSITMTVNTYGHPRQGTNIGLADQLDQAAVMHESAPPPQPSWHAVPLKHA